MPVSVIRTDAWARNQRYSQLPVPVLLALQRSRTDAARSVARRMGMENQPMMRRERM